MEGRKGCRAQAQVVLADGAGAPRGLLMMVPELLCVNRGGRQRGGEHQERVLVMGGVLLQALGGFDYMQTAPAGVHLASLLLLLLPTVPPRPCPARHISLLPPPPHTHSPCCAPGRAHHIHHTLTSLPL
jgi:hypothetical protein